MNLILKRVNSFFRGIQRIFSFYQLQPKQLTASLSNFYSTQSVKRTNTRKKERPEFEIILEDIKNTAVFQSYSALKDSATIPIKNTGTLRHWGSVTMKPALHIVELGCGDGRFAQYLDEKLRVPFTYVGIDAAWWLIQTAKERSFANQVQFFVGDMTLYLAALEQQSVDIIISMASIQHLHKSFRQSLRNNAYRVLHYDGLHITTNRSYSKRMFAKHWKAMIVWFFLRLFNHGTFGRSDYMIPFKTPTSGWKAEKPNGWNVFNIDLLQKPKSKSNMVTLKQWSIEAFRTDYRFYHLYLLGELLEYAHTAGFVVTKSGYISSDWVFNDSRKSSRNTYVVAKKDVDVE